MKLPSLAFGILLGASAATAVWHLASKSATAGSAPRAASGDSLTGQGHPAHLSAIAPPHPSSTISGADHLAALRADLEDRERSETANANHNSSADKNGTHRQRRSGQTTPPKENHLALTTAQLEKRALAVEEIANQRLQELAERFDLSEQQQDQIFPTLARSAPGFVPILQPETPPGLPLTSPVGGNDTFGDVTSIEPGAPMTQIEEEIFADLDQTQQAELEEAAMDREAWWEDITAMLEGDLDEATPVNLLAENADNTEDGSTTSTITEEERAAAAATNEVTDFSNLFGN